MAAPRGHFDLPLSDPCTTRAIYEQRASLGHF